MTCCAILFCSGKVWAEVLKPGAFVIPVSDIDLVLKCNLILKLPDNLPAAWSWKCDWKLKVPSQGISNGASICGE